MMNRIFYLAIIWWFLIQPLMAQQDIYQHEIGLKTIFLDYQTMNGGEFTTFKDYSQGLEVFYLHRLNDRIKIGVPLRVGVIRDSLLQKRITALGGDIVGQYHFLNKKMSVVPYIMAGAGISKELEGGSNIQFPVGLGINFRVHERAYVNWQSEFRFSTAENKTNFHHGIGVKFMLGNAKEKAKVETDPKLVDSDMDGVPDYLDLCPKVAGLTEFHGCPDTDKDGVPDYLDACPDEPGLAKHNGCPDSDGDGVPDHMDECPKVAGPASSKGCPEVKVLDADGDGVADHLDKCPETPRGVSVDKDGCPIDSDGDGVPDHLDKCANTPKGAPVDKDGCLLDSDGDGIADYMDKCPGTQKGTKVDETGCPMIEVGDVDNDGVPDHLDKCPDTPRGSKVNRDGCPDRDGDGVLDNQDKCPEKPGLPVYEGCPDSDGDGVPDHLDRCPNTAGPVWNNGCPEIKKEDQETLNVAMRSVQFETGLAVLKPESFKTLGQIVQIMIKYPDYNLSISGHTDNTGTPAKNQLLSEERAKACYEFLVGSGVNSKRMTHTGYGETRPIATNGSVEGRALNRRVEFKLVPGK